MAVHLTISPFGRDDEERAHNGLENPPSVGRDNAFSAMLKRKRITPDEALKALQVYGKIPIRFLDVELEQSLKIAHELNIYAYDAYIIRCAQKYRAVLVSLDRNLVASAKSMGIQVKEVC